ncbi:hypothetical protein ACIQRZ_26930 [Streptomyces rubiginosohelvolus]
MPSGRFRACRDEVLRGVVREAAVCVLRREQQKPETSHFCTY